MPHHNKPELIIVDDDPLIADTLMLAPAANFNALLETARRQLQTSRPFNLDDTLQLWERGYVEAALGITRGNLTRAARLLGIHRTTLYSRMQNYAQAADKAELK